MKKYRISYSGNKKYWSSYNTYKTLNSVMEAWRILKKRNGTIYGKWCINGKCKDAYEYFRIEHI